MVKIHMEIRIVQIETYIVKQLKHFQNVFSSNINRFIISYKVYAVMCIGISKTHLIALLTIIACPRALKYVTSTTIGYHGEQRSISCMNNLIYSWSPRI